MTVYSLDMLFFLFGILLSLKKERNPEHAIARTKLEDFMLNKISQSYTHTHTHTTNLYDSTSMQHLEKSDS